MLKTGVAPQKIHAILVEGKCKINDENNTTSSIRSY